MNVQRREGLYGFDFLEEDGRRVPAEERKAPEIKALWQRNHEILDLSARGYNGVEIAEILNIHPQTVSNTLNSELGKRKMSEIRYGKDEEVKKVTEKVRVLTNKALNVYHEIFDNEAGEASLKAQKETADTVVLELSGLRVPAKSVSVSAHTRLSEDEISNFKKRGIAAARESGMIIDIEPEEKKSDGVD